MSNPTKAKTYSDTFIYSIAEQGTNHSISKAIIEFIGKADRINPVDSSFKSVADQVKLKQTSSVLYKIMLRKDVVLCVYNKEMPATMKVFAAKDLLYDKKRRVFVDCTGLISIDNGYWVCKDVGKLCSYLFAAMINLIYMINPFKLTANSSLIKSSIQCFVKMFTGILDNLRTINYEENRSKISYIAGVYYLYNMMGKDINYSRATSMSAVKISPRDAQAYDLYYDIDKDLMNIDTLIRDMVHFFNLKGLDTSVYIDRWSFVYGKGTMYGMEYLPAFFDILAYAYVGSYLNNQKSIELICRQDMVKVATILLDIGTDMFNNVNSMELESALENCRSKSDITMEDINNIMRKTNFLFNQNGVNESSLVNNSYGVLEEDAELLNEVTGLKLYSKKNKKFQFAPIYKEKEYSSIKSELEQAEEFLNSKDEPTPGKVNRQLANVSNIIRKVSTITARGTAWGSVGAAVGAAGDYASAAILAKGREVKWIGLSPIQIVGIVVCTYLVSRIVTAISNHTEDANTMKAINKDIESLEAFKKKTKNKEAIKRCDDMINKLTKTKEKMKARGVKEEFESDFDSLVPVD